MAAGGEAGDRPRNRGWRVARRALGIAGAVVLLAVGAVLIATLLINPDRYKGRIETAVRRETGRPFVLEGPLRLTWFPWLGVHMGAARLGAPQGAAGPDLIDWRSAAVRVRLLPLLLHRQLEVGRIRIVGADIHLRRAPDGRGSWEDLLARLHSATGPGAASTSGTAASPAAAAAPATWGGLDLERSSLDYVDERSREHVLLEGWRLEVGAYRAGEPLPVRTSFVLHLDEPATNPPPGAPGTLRLPAAGVRVSLDIPRLQAQASPLRVAAPEWSLQIAAASLRGSAAASRDAAGGLTATGSLAATVPSLRELAHTLGLALPATDDPAALAALSLSGSWRYRDGALAVEALAARLDATTLTGWIARSGGAKPLWTFALRADQVDFGRYLTRSRSRKPLVLPVSELQALHAQGTLRLDRARIDGTTLKNVRLQVQ